MLTIDRMLFFSFLRAYAIVLVSMLSLYIVVDLFTNIDDFAQDGRGLAEVSQHIVTFYSYNVIQIFDRLCEAIVLLAAMFTVAWMQRSNELLPLLSSGVSTRRVLRPVLCGAIAMIGLGILNQELVIPQVGEKLMAQRDDPHGEKQIAVQGAYDSNGVHIEGMIAIRKDKSIKLFYVTTPETNSSAMIHISAQEAVYIPPAEGQPYTGGWLMTGTNPAEMDNPHPSLQMIDPGKWFLSSADVTFDMVTRQRTWFIYASTRQLRELLERPDGRRMNAVAVLYHMRLTRPIVGMLLVLIGLGIILRDQNRHVFISTGMCLAMCAIFYAAVFGCKYLGENDYLAPALAAWFPVILFTPLAITMFDAVHT